jgi:hypothetical protein
MATATLYGSILNWTPGKLSPGQPINIYVDLSLHNNTGATDIEGRIEADFGSGYSGANNLTSLGDHMTRNGALVQCGSVMPNRPLTGTLTLKTKRWSSWVSGSWEVVDTANITIDLPSTLPSVTPIGVVSPTTPTTGDIATPATAGSWFSKYGLWVGLGVVAVVILALVFWPHKK